MEKWRRKGDKCNQEFARTKYNYHYKKPSVGGNLIWHPNVPYWEKKFVSSVGCMSWKKFLEAKEFTHLYDNIMKWDDCAGAEAFNTAKDRFHAKFHGLACDVESHNPDLYIDTIDWNAQTTDCDLIQDLESEPAAPDDASHHEPVVIFEDVLPDPYKDYSPYGWGDSDDMKREQGGINWDDYVDNKCDDWWDWNGNNNKAADQGWNTTAYDNDDNNNNYYYANSNVHNNKYMSSHKTWKFHGNGNQRRNSGNWRKSTGQSQHGHGSSFQAQRVHVHQ